MDIDAKALGLASEVERLRAAIRHHRDQKGDDRCWLDDRELYSALPESDRRDIDAALPPKCEFLKSCDRFWEQRQSFRDKSKGEDGRGPDSGLTIRQLENERTAYRLALAAIRSSVQRLWGAVAKGQYDARSIVGDEALNMMQEYEELERDGRGVDAMGKKATTSTVADTEKD